VILFDVRSKAAAKRGILTGQAAHFQNIVAGFGPKPLIFWAFVLFRPSEKAKLRQPW